MKELYISIAEKINKKLLFISVPYFIINMILKISELLHINLGVSRENLKGLKKMKYFEPDVFENFKKNN